MCRISYMRPVLLARGAGRALCRQDVNTPPLIIGKRNSPFCGQPIAFCHRGWWLIENDSQKNACRDELRLIIILN